MQSSHRPWGLLREELELLYYSVCMLGCERVCTCLYTLCLHNKVSLHAQTVGANTASEY